MEMSAAIPGMLGSARRRASNSSSSVVPRPIKRARIAERKVVDTAERKEFKKLPQTFQFAKQSGDHDSFWQFHILPLFYFDEVQELAHTCVYLRATCKSFLAKIQSVIAFGTKPTRTLAPKQSKWLNELMRRFAKIQSLKLNMWLPRWEGLPIQHFSFQATLKHLEVKWPIGEVTFDITEMICEYMGRILISGIIQSGVKLQSLVLHNVYHAHFLSQLEDPIKPFSDLVKLELTDNFNTYSYDADKLVRACPLLQRLSLGGTVFDRQFPGTGYESFRTLMVGLKDLVELDLFVPPEFPSGPTVKLLQEIGGTCALRKLNLRHLSWAHDRGWHARDCRCAADVKEADRKIPDPPEPQTDVEWEPKHVKAILESCVNLEHCCLSFQTYPSLRHGKPCLGVEHDMMFHGTCVLQLSPTTKSNLKIGRSEDSRKITSIQTASGFHFGCDYPMRSAKELIMRWKEANQNVVLI